MYIKWDFIILGTKVLSQIKFLSCGHAAHKIELNFWPSEIFEKCDQISLWIRLFFRSTQKFYIKTENSKKKYVTSQEMYTKWDFIILGTKVLSQIKFLSCGHVARKIELNFWPSEIFEKSDQISLWIRLFFRPTQKFDIKTGN